MHDLLAQLLSLRDLSLSDPDVSFQFARPLPAYAWTLILLGCALVAGWSYSRLEGSRPARILLGTLRASILALLALLIAGPELTRQNERTEKDWIVVLADRSQSMLVADGPADASGTRATRDAQAKAALGDAWPALAELARERNVMFLGFDQLSYDLRVARDADGSPMGVDLAAPQGRRTRIAQSLEQTLRRVAAKPVAGIVLLSDGRSSDRVGRAMLRQLESRQIPIFSVPLGGESSLADLAIRRVDAPTAAFAGDIVPITIEVEALGLREGEQAPRARVRLLDGDGNTLDERTLPAPANRNEPAQVTLTTQPATEGAQAWTVVVEPASADLTRDNNTASIRVDVIDRPIRVAYFDGYPRWEHRYLKNLLLREPSVRSSVLLLAGDKRYIQEGSDLLAALPRTQEEWNQFDVIIMGDMRPELFSDDQLRQIREWVAQRGGGLLLLGGPGAMPTSWRNSQLADLVPFAIPDASAQSVWSVPVTLRRSPAAGRLGVMQLGESADDPFPAFLSDGSLAWTMLRWAQRIDPTTLKPTAEVLATIGPPTTAATTTPGAIDTDAPADEATPLVLSMRYGAGRSVYVATDEIWRLRYGRGETLTERFWIPIVRLLARESLARGGSPATLEASPSRALVEQQVSITLRLLDQTLLDSKPESIDVRVRLADAPASADVGIPVTLRPEHSDDPAAAAGEGLVGRYTGVFVPTDPGAYIIDSRDPAVAGLALEARFEAFYPDDELRTPQPDHPYLAELATATGGQVLQTSQLRDLATLLPNRELKILGNPNIETLWDKPIVLILFLLLAAMEWIGRRLTRLA